MRTGPAQEAPFSSFRARGLGLKSYSVDLHQKVLEAVLAGRGTQLEIARTFGVSRQFITELVRRHRSGEPIGPKRGHVGSPKIGPEHQAVVRELLAEKNDRTLRELCDLLVERGGPRVSLAAMCYTLQRLGLPRKKRRFTTASEIRRES